MKEDKIALEDVVVTRICEYQEVEFYGNGHAVKREDILKVAGRNVIDALQVFDPSLRIMKNNLMGSDPNTLPEFLRAGTFRYYRGEGVGCIGGFRRVAVCDNQ